MLYHVRMDVHPPRDLPQAEFDRLKAAEKARA
ncbi:MAG: muconolactone delta-isomerase, partial [Acidiphilium sp. 37-67-22]